MGVLKAVLDTNVLISAFIGKGLSKDIVRAAVRKEFVGVSCNFILNEFKEKMESKFPSQDTRSAFNIITKKFYIVSDEDFTKHKVAGVVRDDPDDDNIITCAIASKSKYVVTYDTAIIDLQHYGHGKQKIAIFTPKEFAITLGL